MKSTPNNKRSCSFCSRKHHLISVGQPHNCPPIPARGSLIEAGTGPKPQTHMDHRPTCRPVGKPASHRESRRASLASLWVRSQLRPKEANTKRLRGPCDQPEGIELLGFHPTHPCCTSQFALAPLKRRRATDPRTIQQECHKKALTTKLKAPSMLMICFAWNSHQAKTTSRSFVSCVSGKANDHLEIVIQSRVRR